ncbi:MAG: hypothetical protein DRP58_09780 [Spirochaetes bacterium]|nr:MAG: hypothetical protein DRP58_09780 [Spirochaetota bacterium]
MDRATNLTNQLLTFTKGGDPIIENISIGKSIVEIAEFSLRGSNSKLHSKIDPKAKIIVSSGYATDPIMANYKDFGFIGIAVKPYSFKDLEKEIDRVLKLNYE